MARLEGSAVNKKMKDGNQAEILRTETQLEVRQNEGQF